MVDGYTRTCANCNVIFHSTEPPLAVPALLQGELENLCSVCRRDRMDHYDEELGMIAALVLGVEVFDD